MAIFGTKSMLLKGKTIQFDALVKVIPIQSDAFG
jgi:hypothetical protein